VADWLPVLVVCAAAVGYGVCLRRAQPVAMRVPRWAAAAFGSGLATTAAALAPPFHEIAERSFTGHMVQHVLLICVAAPLLVLGEPGAVVLRAVAPERRRRWRSWLIQSRSGWGLWAAGAIALQAVVMWSWHAPVLFEAALRSDVVHGIEHATLLGSSMIVWWALLRGRRRHRGGAALALFVGAFPGTALGAALLLAPHPWLPSYSHHGVTAALADQQMAGVVMWSVAGIAYVVGAAVLFGTWLASEEARSLRTSAPSPAPRTAPREGDSYAY
jgi:putative membrane protein